MKNRLQSLPALALLALALPALWLAALLAAASPATAQQQQRQQSSVDTTKLAGMQARSIGPAGMSGRVTTIDAVERDPDIIYTGTASGGLWKSESGGTSWQPIFDNQPVASIGSVDIFQQNPSIIYVGTGEGNPRNSEAAGNGVYKTRDGGRTWQHLGLEATRNIHRVIVHPEDPDVAFVGAQGATWGETEERGVYKTTDGGETWEKVLYVDQKTGVADLVMDPTNPDKLIAAMWEYRRWPWFFKSGGPGSGLYVSQDGGETWTERTVEDGLPEGPLGRMGLAIAPSDPDRVYAIVESDDNALYRSDDGGVSWSMVNNEEEIGGRPFYYADIYVDPQNANRVYSLHGIVTYSVDGGESFDTLIPYAKVHPDHHAWWIHPEDPSLIMDGNDGGMAISRDRGETWRFVENLPLAQFYHINYDMERPYHVYGGMQDNGSWKGPSRVWRNGGIRNAYWQEVAFGDGFDVVPDPENARYGYAMSQGGNLSRYDAVSGAQELIRPQAEALDDTLRFNWNAAIEQDPFDAATIYYGSQYVHKSTSRGDSWETISPDLTTDNPERQRQLESGGLTYDVTEAENFTSIVSIAASPVEEGVLWAGTDDGNLQVTRDGGETWTNVVGNVEGVPEGTWVPDVRPSPHRASEALVVFDNHRRNDFTPYVYRTRDYGRSWERLVRDGDVQGYALTVAQDPEAENLLFTGTSSGLYFSLDGGGAWTKWTHGFPTVPTRDLKVHPREGDLVIGTFGRAAYVLDDLRPLRALADQSPALLSDTLTVFDAPDAVLAQFNEAPGTRFTADAEFAGENAPYGALLSYAVSPPEVDADSATADTASTDTASMSAGNAEGGSSDGSEASLPDEVTLQIIDAEGDTIRTLNGPAEPGVNRMVWNLRRKGIRSPQQPEPEQDDPPEPAGPSVLPGTYTARISYGSHADTTTVRVHPDPRIEMSERERQARYALQQRLLERIELATKAADRLRGAQETIGMVSDQLAGEEGEAASEARDMGEAMRDSIQALLNEINPREVQGIRRDPSVVSAQLGRASYYLQSEGGRPGPTDRRALERAESTLSETVTNINQFFEEDWPAYREAVEAANPSLFERYEPLEMSSSNGGSL